MSLVSLIIEALAQLRDVTITSPTSGQALTYNSSTNKWNNTTVSTLSSPLTTKGDIWGYGTTNSRLPVGTDTYALVADSTQTTGLRYANLTSTYSTPAPAVRCYNSTDETVAHATLTALTFDTNLIDQGTSTAQHSTSAATNKITCRQAGVYYIAASVSYTTNAMGDRAVYLRVNGSNVIAGSRVPTALTASNTTDITVGTTYPLSVGDYVEVLAYQTSTVTLNALASANYSPEFMMARVDTGALPSITWATKTTNYTILTTDRQILVDTSGGAVTITLPTAVGAAQLYSIKKKTSDTNAVTIAGAGGQTIDGAATQVLSVQYQSIDVSSDNTNWYIS